MYPWSPKFPLLSELDRMPCRGPPLSHGTGRRDARRADHHFHLRAAVYGQAEGEPGAPPGFAFHSDGSGMLADNLVADGKTQPRTRPDALGCKHGVEDVRKRFETHPHAGVGDLDGHLARFPVVGRRRKQADLQLASAGHRVHAVIDQVEEDLLQIAGVAIDGRTLFRPLRLDLDLPELKRGGREQDGILQDATDVEPFDAQVELARPGEQLLDGPNDIVDLVFDDLKAPLGPGIPGLAPGQQLHVARNRIEGRPNLVGQAGGQLPGHGQPFRTGQALLGLEQLFVDLPKLLVPPRQFRGRLHHLALELGIEVLDPAQHAVQVHRQLPDLIVAGDVGAEEELPAFRSLHHPDHLFHRPPDAPHEERVDHQDHDGQAGQHQHQVPEHQVPGDRVQSRLRDLEVQATNGLPLVINRRSDDPETVVRSFNRYLLVVGPLELVVVFDVGEMVEFEVLALRVCRGQQVVLGVVHEDIALLDARKVVLDLPQGLQKGLGILEGALVGQLVSRQSRLGERLAVNLFLNGQPRQPHGDVGGDANDEYHCGGNNDYNLPLEAKPGIRHRTWWLFYHRVWQK